MRKRTVAEERTENIKSPQGKQCKTFSPSSVSSTGCQPDVVVNSLLPYTLPVNNFSIFKVDSGKKRFQGKTKKKETARYPFTN